MRTTGPWVLCRFDSSKPKVMRWTMVELKRSTRRDLGVGKLSRKTVRRTLEETTANSSAIRCDESVLVPALARKA